MEGPTATVDKFLQRTQDFRLFAPDMHRRTEPFSQSAYERGRNRQFDSLDQAYADWISHGRQEGVEFAPGKNTILKVVLKVKDEPEFLPLCVSYYASMVGYHNIIVVDCGSEERSHLDYLHELSSKALVLSYLRHYDDLHHIQTNKEFYELVSSSCKYLALLDADEFLFGHKDGLIGASLVEPILKEGDQSIYAGTWFPNAIPFSQDYNSSAQFFNIDNHIITFGTIAGKSILRSKICLDVINIGHNLHVSRNIELFNSSSFGAFGILHLTKSEIRIARHRSLKHLRSKGVVPDTISETLEIESYLKRILAENKIHGIEAHYARKYIGVATAEETAEGMFEASLSAASLPVLSPNFSKRRLEFRQ